MRSNTLILLAVASLLFGCSGASPPAFSDADRDAIRVLSGVFAWIFLDSHLKKATGRSDTISVKVKE